MEEGMLKKTFEEFLIEQHAAQFKGTKDQAVDDFDRWLQGLSVDQWIVYGDKYVASLV